MAAGGVLVGRGYVSIRPEFEGDWSRQASARASRAGRSAGGGFSKAFGAGLKGLGALAGVAVAANLSGAAGAAAALAPALSTAGTAAAALKLGLSGVGDAFKAAFADSSAQASSAASATRAVESAQRGLANAQRALADARVQAAERVREAQEGVRDAERDLADAQREARQVQGELNDARREAARALQDMNQRLAESRLDEREAVLRLKEAQEELQAAQERGGVDPDELERLQLAYERAKLNLQEQRRDTKRLAEDTKAANKAGIEGSEQVLAVKDRISEANRTVADRERALAEAHADVDKARVDGARQIEDAQRAVADAAAAVADAQAAAAAQASKFDEAMSKLAPNARDFVNAVRGLAPAWRGMRMSVQNRLFEGLDTTVTGLANDTIPILRRQLTETAGIWNAMAKNAAGAISEMAKSGLLEKVFEGANQNFRAFEKVPGQLITAWAQLSVAAQPAMERLSSGFAGAISSFTDGIAKGFASGGLEQGINTAFEILSQFGQLLGNILGSIGQIFKAASDAGGEIVGALSAVFGELRRVLGLPEIQAQLRTLFAAVAQIVQAIVPIFGAVVQAIVPVLAAIAPAVAEIATAAGPVLEQLATILGQALLPIVQSLMPVLTQVGLLLVQVVQAVMPLLQPIANLISAVVTALAPALTPIINVVTQLVGVLVGPLTSVVQTLTPALVAMGELVVQVFQAFEPFLAPLVQMLGQIAGIVAGVFAQALNILMQAIEPLLAVGMQLIDTVLAALTPLLPIIADAFEVLGQALVTMLTPLESVWGAIAQLAQAMLPLIPIGVDLVTTVFQALVPVLPVIAQAFVGIATAAVALITPLAGVVAQLMGYLAPILQQLAPIIGQIAELLVNALAAALPPLTEVLLILVEALKPIFPLIGQILGMVVELGASLIAQLLPPLLDLVQAGVDLFVALAPILPPLAEIISLVISLAVNVLSWLLPPLIRLASVLAGGLASAISTVVGWLSDLVSGISTVITWVRTHLGPAFTWLNQNIVQPVWRAIRGAVEGAWNKGIKPAFEAAKKGVAAVGNAFEDAKNFIKRAWDKVMDIAKKPVRFIIEKIYNAGIVPTWNKVATAFGANPIKKMDISGWATGGVLPGYTPGRDVHQFYSPGGMGLELSGGEAIMRPEWTRAVGSQFVGTMNRIAKARGAKGVKEALAPALGGSAPMRTDRTLRYAEGGIFSWIGKKAAGAGTALWNGVKKGASWLKDTLEGSARAGLKSVVDPLLRLFPGADTNFGKMIRKIPNRILDAIFGYSKTADKKGGGGLGGPRIQAALKWAKTQNGLPYQWGGNGNPSWDCSGFMSAIESVIRGQKPHRRWSTHAFNGGTPPGWVRNGKSPFQVGITHAGVGHTAGTLGGVNVESRGGDGVVVGKRARGANSMLFTDVYGFMPGKYDAGGWLGPGQTGVNQLRQPEAILTPSQWQTMSTLAAAGGGGLQAGDRLRLAIRDREFEAYLEAVADDRVDATLRPAITAMRANRRG